MEIFYNFGIEVKDINYRALTERYDQYFGGRENKTILRHRFLTLAQGEEEALHDFTPRATRGAKQKDALWNFCGPRVLSEANE